MSDSIQSVDVEKIMEEIRANINARGETAEVLSFDESFADAEYDNEIVGSVEYNEKELHHFLVNANQGHNIPFYQMIPKAVPSLYKKIYSGADCLCCFAFA